MAKDIIFYGLFVVTLLQMFCTVVYCSQFKGSKSYVKTGPKPYNFNNLIYYKKGLENLNDMHQVTDLHTLPARINYETSKQGEDLNNLLWKKKTNIINANIERGSQKSLLRKLNTANNQHLSKSKINNRVNYGILLEENKKSSPGMDYKGSILSASHYNLPQTRLKRSTRTEHSHGLAKRHKRDISGDTEVGLIMGACVLGLLAAVLLICACIRCNAVRKSADGKGTVPDFTPTLFAVAKGYDNVAFDNDDLKAEVPSNEIPMTENIVSGQTYQTVSVA